MSPHTQVREPSVSRYMRAPIWKGREGNWKGKWRGCSSFQDLHLQRPVTKGAVRATAGAGI